MGAVGKTCVAALDDYDFKLTYRCVDWDGHSKRLLPTMQLLPNVV